MQIFGLVFILPPWQDILTGHSGSSWRENEDGVQTYQVTGQQGG